MQVRFGSLVIPKQLTPSEEIAHIPTLAGAINGAWGQGETKDIFYIDGDHPSEMAIAAALSSRGISVFMTPANVKGMGDVQAINPFDHNRISTSPAYQELLHQ